MARKRKTTSKGSEERSTTRWPVVRSDVPPTLGDRVERWSIMIDGVEHWLILRRRDRDRCLLDTYASRWMEWNDRAEERRREMWQTGYTLKYED